MSRGWGHPLTAVWKPPMVFKLDSGFQTTEGDFSGSLRGSASSLITPLPRMLRNNRISCIHNDSFTGLRNVRLLSLYDNHITTISPGAFDTLQALSTL